MADKYISGLTAKVSLEATDELPIAAAGATGEGSLKKTTVADIVVFGTAFTEFSGTEWDGSNKFYTPSGNMVFTIDSNRACGVFNLKSNSSYTLSLNGTNIPINATGKTSIGFMKVDGEYWILDKDENIIVLGADVTAPTVVSATAINANTIRIVFSEAMGAVTTSGHSFKQNGTPITPDSVGGSGTTWDFVVSETLLNTDTILRSYNSGTGATTDDADTPNELASYTDAAVTNSIAGALYVTDDFSGGDDADIDGRTTITGGGTWDAVGANTGAIKIQSGLARLNTTMLVAKCHVDANIRNLNAEVVNGSVGSGNNTYIIMGYVDENNYIQLHVQDGHTYEIVGGTPSELLAASYGGLTTGDVIRGKLDGANFTVYKNGVSMGTTSSVNAAIVGTKHGIYFYQQAGSSISNFETYAI